MIEPSYIKIFLIIMLILFLIGIIIPLILIKRKGMDPHGTHEGYSSLSRLTPISIMVWLLYILLYIFFDEVIGKILAFIFLSLDIFVIIGMITISLGLILEVLAMKTLGLNFRIESPKEETELITSGAYRLMRHPIVFGIFLLQIGCFLLIPNIIMLIIGFANILFFNAKARNEDVFLLARFGKEYENYKNKVGMYFSFKIRKNWGS